MSNIAAGLTLETRRSEMDRLDVPADIPAVVIISHPDGTQCVVPIETLRQVVETFDLIKERS